MMRAIANRLFAWTAFLLMVFLWFQMDDCDRRRVEPVRPTAQGGTPRYTLVLAQDATYLCNMQTGICQSREFDPEPCDAGGDEWASADDGGYPLVPDETVGDEGESWSDGHGPDPCTLLGIAVDLGVCPGPADVLDAVPSAFLQSDAPRWQL